MFLLSKTLHSVLFFVTITGIMTPIRHELFDSRNIDQERLVNSCLESIMQNHFHLRLGQQDKSTLLLTIFVSNDLDSPSQEIQEEMVKRIHEISEWFEIEVVSDGPRYEFESFRICHQDKCRNNFVVEYKTNFYFTVTDSDQRFTDIVDVIENLKTFNPTAFFLIYLQTKQFNNKTFIYEIFEILFEHFMLYGAVLVAENQTVLNLYQLSLSTKGPNACGLNKTVYVMDRCVQGQMMDIKKNYFYTGLLYDFKNCSLGVVAMPYKPFVINENDGIEIKVLQNIEQKFNVHFNVTLSKMSSTWGEKNLNNTWTGNLELVYEQMYFGIGNIDLGRDIDMNDFSFSQSYHSEPLVYVVPIANLVPEWRILTAIFTEEMWGICLSVIFLSALAFFLSARKSGRFTIYYRQPLLTSFQMIIGHPTPKYPTNEVGRIFFLGLSIFSIIISSLYTCSLVYYLKNPIREDQPHKNEDLINQFGYPRYLVGGLKKYEIILRYSHNNKIKYLTADGENDTLNYWLRKVAYERNIWTVASRFYANYLVAENSNITTNSKGKTKVFVFKNKLMTYPIGLIARRGHPMIKKFDKLIKNMLHSGLVIHYCKEYLIQIAKDVSIDSSEDSTLKPLTLKHLQGAFVILLLGFIFGTVVLLIEIIIYKLKKFYQNRKGVICKCNDKKYVKSRRHKKKPIVFRNN